MTTRCSEETCCPPNDLAFRGQDGEHCPTGYTWDGTECVPPPRCDVTPIVTFDPGSGSTVTFPTEVTLACNYSVDIFYTLDGSNPTTESTKYTGPISVSDSDVVIKALPGTECGQSIFTASYIGPFEGMIVWLKADTLGLSDGTLVTTWPDASGFSNDFTGSTNRYPTFKTNIQNSLPGVDFEIVSFNFHGLSCASDILVKGDSFSIAVVCNPKVSNSNTRRAVQLSPSNWLLGPYGVNWNLYNGSFIADSAAGTSAAVLIGRQSISGGPYPSFIGNTDFYVNGTLIGSAVATTGPGLDINSDCAVGLGGAGLVTGETMEGYIFELLVYPFLLSSGQVASLNNYLRTKWAI